MSTLRKYLNNMFIVGLVGFCAGCGGSGGGNDDEGQGGSISYAVTASVGIGGSISPDSAAVNEGDTTVLSITPDNGFDIDSVTGCSGTLSGANYTTAAINADCEVIVTFVEAPSSGTDIVFLNRPVSGEVDFDNNGIADAEETYEYDTNGRLTKHTYTYFGDGTPDLYRAEVSHYTDSVEYIENYVYNARGLLIEIEMIEIAFSGELSSEGSGRTVTTYEYDINDQASSSIQEVFDEPNGQLIIRVVSDYSYDSEGRLDSIAQEHESFVNIILDPIVDPVQNFRTAITYNNDSLPTVYAVLNSLDEEIVVEYREWSANKQLISLRQETPFAGEFEVIIDREHSYDSNGCLISETRSEVDDDDNFFELYELTYHYEGNGNAVTGASWDQYGDGSIEVVLTLETENVPHIPLQIPGIFSDTYTLFQSGLCL